MLQSDLDKTYVVYPSWAQFSYEWRDLPTLLADPWGSDRIKQLEKEIGLSRTCHPSGVRPFQLLDGAAGNGIIFVDASRAEDWIPRLILTAEANRLLTGPMTPLDRELQFDVTYLEPMSHPDVMLGLKPRQKTYLCPISAEHLDSAEERIFWVVGFKKGSRKPRGLGEVERIGEGFGMSVLPLDGRPAQVEKETEAWFPSPDYEYFWFEIESKNRGAGFHFAVVVYLGLHLASVTPSRMAFMHLMAQIPGKPNVRMNMKHW